jgi:GT2 family glycosyltransferase
MDLTVVFVNYNTGTLLAEAIGDLRRASPNLKTRIVVVDNSSHDGSIALIGQRFPDCRLIANQDNIGFGRANNQALAEIEGRYVLLLNTDAFVAPDSLDKTVAYMDAHPRCGILGVRLVGRDGALQPCARYFPTPWSLFLQRTNLGRWLQPARPVDDLDWDHRSVRQCDWVPGCFYLVRRALIDEIGLFDPRYFLYYEEIDHCLAARRAGWEVTFFPDTTVVHIGGESARTAGAVTPQGRQIAALRMESELLYFRKNHGLSAALASVALTTLGDAVIAAKRLLRRRRQAGGGAGALLAWSLFLRTRLGTRPTR